MAELIRPELANVDGREVTDLLVGGSVTGGIQTWVADDGMHIVVDDTQQAAATSLLDGWTPTSTRDGTYVTPFDSVFQTHLGHLRTYLAADPSTITNAESVEAIKDCIRALRWLNNRLQ